MQATLRIENIKGQTKTVILDRINVITGKNGSGKSTIMEALAIAIDGEHPTAGKTLAAICSIVTGEKGKIQLTMVENGNEIEIVREFTNTEAKTSQKIFINGRDMLQAQAQEKINEFMGGGGMRKMSPYRFVQMSPKDRLTAIAELMPKAATSNMEDAVKRGICFQSDEFSGQARYSLGKTKDELSNDEIEALIAKAEMVDHEYFAVARKYIITQGNKSDLEFIDYLIDNNKKAINDTQQDITRLTKAIQTHQDNLGSDLLPYTVAEVDAELDKLKDLEIAKSNIISNNAKLKELRDRLQKAKDDLGFDIKEVAKEQKTLAAAMKAYEKHKDAPGDVGGYEQQIKTLKERIENSAGADDVIAGLNKELSDLSINLATKIKDNDNDVKAYNKSTVAISTLQGGIKELEKRLSQLKDNKCPLCKSEIDIDAIRTSYEKEADKLRKCLEFAIITKDKFDKKLALNNQDIRNNKKAISDIESKLAVAISKQLTPTFITDANTKIAGYVAAIEACGFRDLYNDAKKQMELIESKQAQIKQLDTQLAEAKPEEVVTPEEMQGIAANTEIWKQRRKDAANAESINKLIAAEQINLKGLESKRKIEKTIKEVLLSCKEDSYWFIKDIMSTVKRNIGDDAIMSNDIFGVNRNGILISDKVLSGGEKIMYSTSIMAGIMSLSGGISIAEVEGSELDSENILKTIDIVATSRLSMAIIATHNHVGDVPSCNMIRL